MPEPQPTHVEGFEALTKQRVDLRRMTAVGRLAASPTAVRMLMSLFVGPLNVGQLSRIAKGGICEVHRAVTAMVGLGLVSGDGRERFGEYRVTSRGRRLLRDLIDAAAGDEADPLIEFVASAPVRSSPVRLRRGQDAGSLAHGTRSAPTVCQIVAAGQGAEVDRAGGDGPLAADDAPKALERPDDAAAGAAEPADDTARPTPRPRRPPGREGGTTTRKGTRRRRGRGPAGKPTARPVATEADVIRRLLARHTQGLKAPGMKGDHESPAQRKDGQAA